ncbi:MAG: ABC transporter ATP-binding protein/permease, partial [Oscillospiraceae bacterium]|nr:ABC transporter ATP-binding protein/permease [Oscillospiraceae bacterium]
MIRGIVHTVGRLLGFMRAARRHLIFSILCMALSRLISVWMIADLLGNGMQAFQSHRMDLLWRAILLALPWLALLLILDALAVWLAGVATARGTVALRTRLMDSMLHATLASSNASHSGVKLSYFTNDIPAAMNGLIRTLAIPAGAVFVGITGFVYVLRVHWAMAAITIAIGIFVYIYSILFAGALHRIAQKMQALLAVLESRLKTLLDGMVTARMGGMVAKLEGQMDDASKDLMHTGIRWARVSGFLGGMNNGMGGLFDNLLVFVAGVVFLSGALSLPELMRVSQMAGGVVGVFHLSRTLVDIQRALAGAGRVFEYMDGTPPERQNGCATPAPGASVQFSDVTFSYDGAPPCINSLSFKADAGEIVALIGRSGSGKSTALRLIQDLYAPSRGKITVHGVAT